MSEEMDYYVVVIEWNLKRVRLIRYDLGCALEVAQAIIIKAQIEEDYDLNIEIYKVVDQRYSLKVHIEA